MSVKQDKVQVSVVVDGKQGISELGKLEMEANDLRHTMQGLKKDSQEYTQAAEQYKQVKASMAELREEIGLAGLTMKQMRSYARELQTELDTGATRGTQRYEELKGKLQEVNAAIAQQRSEVAGTASFWSKISTEVKQFGMLAVGALGFQFVTDQISNLIAKGSKLSDELADVQKTTGMTAAEVRQLNSDLSKLDTRTPTSELRKIAAGAGALGIAKEDILAFAAATDKLVVSLGDEFEGGAEEITKVMGGLRNIFADIKSDKVDVDMLHIGNAINQLGATGSATGPVVADLANRIGGVGITMGLTSGQVLGLSATLQELNVSTERGGTATVKILQAMASEPAKFAKVAGLSTKEFTNLVNTDLYGALVKVTEGAAKSGGQATALAGVLSTLGVDGAGASEVMAKLGTNTELLHQRVKLASSSLGETNSIMSEFATKNDDLAGKMEKLTKLLSGAFTNSVFNDALEAAVDGLTKLFGLTDDAAKLTDEFRAQQAAVQNLEQDTVPLIDRYDELKSKATLNGEEQNELDKIMQQLAETIPSAVTQFDEYGKALGINSAAAREFVQLQKEMLGVKNADAIEKNTEQLELYQRKIAATTGELNKFDAQGRHIRATSDEDGYRVLTDRELTQMTKDLADFQGKVRGFHGVLAELRGEKSEEQLKAESDARWMAYVFGDKKKLAAGATAQLGLLTDIDNQIKVLQEKQMGDRSKAEIRADELAIKALQKQRTDLLGDADDKEQERKRKALEKKAQMEHDQALKGLHELQAIALREQAKLRDVDADADQQALNQLATHYNELLKKAEDFSKNSKLTEKERREALGTLDLLADEKEEALANLREQQRQKRAADELKFENQHALDMANLRILLAKRQEKTNPAEYQAALIAKVELERDIELQNTKLTETQRALIIQEAQDKIDAIKKASSDRQVELEKRAQQQILQATTQMFNTLTGLLTRNNANELTQLSKKKDKSLSLLEQQKNQGIITAEQYEKRKGEVEDEYTRKQAEIKKDQFEKERAINIVKATMDGIMAVMKTLAELGAVAAAPVLPFLEAATALNIAAIASQPAPEFREGGFTANGLTNLPYTNLSRHPGGLPEGPYLATVNEVGAEYFVPHHLLQQPAVARSVEIIEAIRTGGPPAFAQGGYSATPTPSYSESSSSAGAVPLDRATALRLAVATEQLTAQLANPAPVRAYVVYQDVSAAGEHLTTIQQQASF